MNKGNVYEKNYQEYLFDKVINCTMVKL